MKQSLRLVLIGGTALACFVVAGLASAQPIPPQPPAGPIAAPPPPPPGAPAYDAQQLPETRGVVQRYNLALGATAAAWGTGAALSNSVAGFIVNWAGYSTAFLCLAGVALAALALFWLAVPETGKRSEVAIEQQEHRQVPSLRDGTQHVAAE